MDKLTEIRKEHEDLQQTVSKRPEYRIEAMKVLANISYLLQLVETQAQALEDRESEIVRLENELEDMTGERNIWRSNSLDWEGEED